MKLIKKQLQVDPLGKSNLSSKLAKTFSKATDNPRHFLIDLKSSDSSDNGEYNVYGANKEYLASEMKKLQAEMKRLAAKSIQSVKREKITNAVIFM